MPMLAQPRRANLGAEWLGQARFLVNAVHGASVDVRATRKVLSRLVDERQRWGRVKRRTFREVVNEWRVTRADDLRARFDVKQGEDNITATEWRVSYCVTKSDEWHGDAAALCIMSSSLYFCDNRFQLTERVSASVTLHALARRLQRGAEDRSYGGVLHDVRLLAFIAPVPNRRLHTIEVPTSMAAGAWVGTPVHLNARQPVATLVLDEDAVSVRTWLHTDEDTHLNHDRRKGGRAVMLPMEVSP